MNTPSTTAVESGAGEGSCPVQGGSTGSPAAPATSVQRHDDGGLGGSGSNLLRLGHPPAVRAATCVDAEVTGLISVLLDELVEALPGAGCATVVTVLGTRLRPLATAGQAGTIADRLQERCRQGPS